MAPFRDSGADCSRQEGTKLRRLQSCRRGFGEEQFLILADAGTRGRKATCATHQPLDKRPKAPMVHPPVHGGRIFTQQRGCNLALGRALVKRVVGPEKQNAAVIGRTRAARRPRKSRLSSQDLKPPHLGKDAFGMQASR